MAERSPYTSICHTKNLLRVGESASGNSASGYSCLPDDGEPMVESRTIEMLEKVGMVDVWKIYAVRSPRRISRVGHVLYPCVPRPRDLG